MSHFKDWDMARVAEHNRRVARKPAEPSPPPDAALREVEQIHNPLSKWLTDNQIPFIHARTDMASTIGEGAQDYTIFFRGHVICIEAKTATGKLSDKQRGWAILMERQGFKVHVARSLRECQELVLAAAGVNLSAIGQEAPGSGGLEHLHD